VRWVGGWIICPQEQPGLHVEKMDGWKTGDERRALGNRYKRVGG